MKEGTIEGMDANTNGRRSQLDYKSQLDREGRFDAKFGDARKTSGRIARHSRVQFASIRKLEEARLDENEKLNDGCWIDLFEKPWFAGRLRRLRGPAEFHEANLDSDSPGSMIIGPDALVLQIDRKALAGLRPRQLVPDMAQLSLAGQLKAFHLQRAEEAS